MSPYHQLFPCVVEILNCMSYIVPNLNTLASYGQAKNFSMCEMMENWILTFLQTPTIRGRFTKKLMKIKLQSPSLTQALKVQYLIFTFKKCFPSTGPPEFYELQGPQNLNHITETRFLKYMLLEKYIIQKATLNSVILINLY